MTIKQFKAEFRSVCDDTWGSAMDAWFECAGWIHYECGDIPENWAYSPGLSGDGRNPDSYWYDIFSALPRGYTQIGIDLKVEYMKKLLNL